MVVQGQSASVGNDLWACVARSYAAFGSPLVPCLQDIELYERLMHSHKSLHKCQSLEAVLLGVTPGVVAMRWPEYSRVRALDSSLAVIEALWPGDIAGVREVVCGSWFDMHSICGSCDVVLGDGSLNACRFPCEVRVLCRSIRKSIREGGMLVVRCFVQSSGQETVEDVFSSLQCEGGVGVDNFKLRLFLAMQRSSEEGVAVAEAARILKVRGLDATKMREVFEWSDAAIEPFMMWQTSSAVYFFPTLEEICCVLDEYFGEVSVTFPSYTLGASCPIIVAKCQEGHARRRVNASS